MAHPARRVLVVDDDELVREVAQASLELVAGWQVSTAASGVQAQAQAAAERPDAIVLDVMMPGQDGPSTYAALQADAATADIPVIFLTAKHDPTGNQRGAAGVIAKPFDAMRLSRQIEELLGWES